MSEDIGEEHNVATSHPDVVERIAKIMASAPSPSDRYSIGEV